MRRAGRNACLLLLASSGILPAECFANPAVLAERSHGQRIQEALDAARRTLSLERYLLAKLEAIEDPGLSPSYHGELQASRKRVFEAEAWVMALERALQELAPGPSTTTPSTPTTPVSAKLPAITEEAPTPSQAPGEPSSDPAGDPGPPS